MTYRLAAEEDWRPYSTVPDGATVLGVLYREGYPPGVLVRFFELRRKPYVIFNNSQGRMLNGHLVAPLLGHWGRAKKMQGGKPITVYLDAQTLATAETLGKGNISEGIRAALRSVALGTR